MGFWFRDIVHPWHSRIVVGSCVKCMTQLTFRNFEWSIYIPKLPPPPKKKKTGILDESALRCAFWKVDRICTLCISASFWCFVIKGRRCRVSVEPKADLKMIVSDEDLFLFDMFFFNQIMEGYIDSWFMLVSGSGWVISNLSGLNKHLIILPKSTSHFIMLDVFMCYIYSGIPVLSTKHLLRYASGRARL